MKKTIYFLGSTLILSTIYLSLSIPKFNTLENFKLSPQLTASWCWAASIKMVEDYSNNYRKNVDQCEIVKLYKKSQGSDSNTVCPIDSECGNDIQTLTNISFVKTYLKSKNVNSEIQKGLISWPKIKIEIDNKRPIIITNIKANKSNSQWNNHVFVITGYLEIGDLKLAKVHDPWSPCQGCVYLLNYNNIEFQMGSELKLSDAYYDTQLSSFFNIQKNIDISVWDYFSKIKIFILTYLNYGISVILPKAEELKDKSDEVLFSKISKLLNEDKIQIINPNFEINEVNKIGLQKYKVTEVIPKNISPNNSVSEDYTVTKEEICKVVTINGKNITICIVKDPNKPDFWTFSKILGCNWVGTIRMSKMPVPEFITYPKPNTMIFEKTVLKNKIYYLNTEKENNKTLNVFKNIKKINNNLNLK